MGLIARQQPLLPPFDLEDDPPQATPAGKSPGIDDDDEPSFVIDPRPSQARRGTFTPSPQQAVFLDALRDDSKHILLEARAGSGKSRTCSEGARVLPRNLRATYCCFNSHIAKEFQKDLPPSCQAATMHSLGMRILKQHFGQTFTVDSEGEKVLRIAEKFFPGKWEKSERYAVAKLVGLCKNLLLDPEPGILRGLAMEFGVDFKNRDEDILAVVPEVIRKCVDQTELIDFDDMIWMPVALGLQASESTSSDVLFIDECLPGWTPVLLADGTSKTIKEIVESRLETEVLSYDTENGVQRSCKIVNWSKTLNRKPLVKIKARWTRKLGTNRPTNFVICTTDHKVWADGRWTPAGDIEPGMRVQIETSAQKSQVGKITSRGRKTLAGVMSAKNTAGVMVSGTKTRTTPVLRGGNGQGPTLPQSLLYEALGEGWIMEHVIKTAPESRLTGYPHHYKLDIAHPELMIAVEVDGESHRGERREQDRRKDELLRGRGWKVIRVSNRKAVQSTDEVAARILASDCPIGAKVVSVEPIEIEDSYVYDLTIEDCHNFYANGILVHNCQDLNPCQHALVQVFCPEGRTVVVGDRYQSIYAFRGADAESIPLLESNLSTTPRGMECYPLTVTRRCPRSHVEMARRIVPDLDYLPAAPDGLIDQTDPDKWQEEVQPGTMILCRTNAPLISACFRLLANDIKATVRGRDIGKGLLTFLFRLKASSVADLLYKIRAFQDRERGRLSEVLNPANALAALQDRCDCLSALTIGASTVDDVRKRIETLFSDFEAPDVITLSSVHRAKGLEADHVVILRPDLMPFPSARSAEDQQQERNLTYVACTRAKQRLTFAGPLPALLSDQPNL